MIVANGDSWTGGVAPGSTRYFQFGSPELWPNQLELRCSKPVLNLASGASSNYRIFRTTIEQLNIDTPECLVIGWSSADRYEFTLYNGEYVKVTAQGTFWPSREKTIYDKLSKEIYDFYYNRLFNKKLNLKFLLNSVICIQDICRLKNIKLVNFQSSFNNFDDIEKMNDDELNQLYKKIDFNRWIYSKNNPTMSTMMKAEGYPEVSSTYTNAAGQSRWSEIILEHLSRE